MKGALLPLVNQFFFFFKRCWQRYELFGKAAISLNRSFQIKDIFYLQDQLFRRTVLYSFPVSLLILLPSGIVAFVNGSLLIPVVAVFTLAANFLVHFNRQITLRIKKAFAVISLTLLAIFFIAAFGSFGIGSIYLLSLSVFTSLLFSQKVAYWAAAFNFFIYAIFALIINEKLFNLPIVQHYTTKIWIGYSMNFMFLNLLLIFETRHIMYGLEKTILEEVRLLGQLQLEMAENNSRHVLLQESDEHYKSLFFLNPSPMWIVDVESLRFLQVNDAAIREYGYTEAEFLAMSIKDILVDPLDHMLLIIKKAFETNVALGDTAQHNKKNGQVFYAEIKCSTIPFKGSKAVLVIATNINSQIEHLKAIEDQNEKLKKIAFMQSHVIRAPLARIKGLCHLLVHGTEQNADQQILDYLDASVNELDDVIRSIVEHSGQTSSRIDKN